MSIYSGFATRQLEQTYDECLETILFLFQKRLIKFYKGETTDEQKFYALLSKMYEKMRNMENHKYLQPKSSRTIEQIVIFLRSRSKDWQQQKAGNKILQVEQLQQSDSFKRNSMTAPKKSQNQGYTQSKSQRLQSQNSNTNQRQSQKNVLRLSGTNNNIKKRISQKSNHQIAMLRNPNILSARLNRVQNNIKYNQRSPQEKEQKTNKNIIERLQLNKLLNQPDSRFIKISRNQPRTYFNTSHQELRKNIMKSRERQSEEFYEQPTYSTEKDKDDDVNKLIKGYIHKTKRNYMKTFNKRKSEIEEIMKCI